MLMAVLHVDRSLAPVYLGDSELLLRAHTLIPVV